MYYLVIIINHRLYLDSRILWTLEYCGKNRSLLKLLNLISDFMDVPIMIINAF